MACLPLTHARRPGAVITQSQTAGSLSISSEDGGGEIAGGPVGGGVTGGDPADEEAWLLLLEAPALVACSASRGAPKRHVDHPAGAVLARTSSCAPAAGALPYAWHELCSPAAGMDHGGGGDGGAADGGLIVRVASRTTLRWLLGETRKAAVRSHAQTLAGYPLFAPLTPAELLALCHRAVEIEAAEGDLLSAGPPQHGATAAADDASPGADAASDGGGGGGGGTSAMDDDESFKKRVVFRAGSGLTDAGSAMDEESFKRRGPRHRAPRRFMVVLHGSAVVTYTSPPSSPPAVLSVLAAAGGVSSVPPTSTEAAATFSSDSPALPTKLPIARLGPMGTVGAIGALTQRPLSRGVEICASAGGATLLSWTQDEYLSKQLARLPELLSSCWMAEAPLSLAPHVPSLLPLIRPLTLGQMRSRYSTRPEAHHARDDELLIVLQGTLREDVGLHVSIEKQPKRLGSGGSASSDGAAGGGAESAVGGFKQIFAKIPFLNKPSSNDPPPASGGGNSSARSSFDGAQHLRVTVELTAREHLLADLSTLLAELEYERWIGHIAA